METNQEKPQSMTVDDAMQYAVRFYKEDKLDLTRELCAQILNVQPENAMALHLMGITLHRMGNDQESVSCITKAVQYAPDYYEAFNSLGNIFLKLGAFPQACESYKRALLINPEYVDAEYHLGIALLRANKSEEAILCLKKLSLTHPEYRDLCYHLGLAYNQDGRFREAVNCFQKTLNKEADNEDAKHNLMASYNNLARELVDKGEFEEAISIFHKALVLKPDAKGLYNNLAGTHNNLANYLHEQGKYDEAVINFQRAIAIKPDMAEAHFGYGATLLLKGNFHLGWREYDWRKKARDFLKGYDSVKSPLWSGKEDLRGKSILVVAEQGHGDAFHFVRYIPMLSRMGAKVFLSVKPALRDILEYAPGVSQFVFEGEPLPETDYHCLLLDLPHIFTLSVEEVPAEVPYLLADQDMSAAWEEKLSGIKELKVGLCWMGSKGYSRNHLRSPGIAPFLELKRSENVLFFCLQKDGRGEFIQAFGEERVYDPGREIDEGGGAFMETAALMENLDLIITCDTSIAHLAGALGCPVWLMLPYVPEWRWLLERDDSPWYPTMRVFRQYAIGDWSMPFNRAANDLALLVGGDKTVLLPQRKEIEKNHFGNLVDITIEEKLLTRDTVVSRPPIRHFDSAVLNPVPKIPGAENSRIDNDEEKSGWERIKGFLSRLFPGLGG